MKINWKEWDNSRKLIIIGLLVALVSMFLPWTKIGGVSVLGVMDITILALILWVHPILQILNDRSIKRTIGIVLSIASGLFGIIFIIIRSIPNIENVSVGFGAYLYLVASLLYIAGIFINKKTNVKATPVEVKPKAEPAEVKPATTPAEVKPATTPVEVKPKATPVEVKPKAEPAEVKPAATPAEVKPKPVEVKKETPKKAPVKKPATTKKTPSKKASASKKATPASKKAPAKKATPAKKAPASKKSEETSK